MADDVKIEDNLILILRCSKFSKFKHMAGQSVFFEHLYIYTSSCILLYWIDLIQARGTDSILIQFFCFKVWCVGP